MRTYYLSGHSLINDDWPNDQNSNHSRSYHVHIGCGAYLTSHPMDVMRSSLSLQPSTRKVNHLTQFSVGFIMHDGVLVLLKDLGDSNRISLPHRVTAGDTKAVTEILPRTVLQPFLVPGLRPCFSSPRPFRRIFQVFLT